MLQSHKKKRGSGHSTGQVPKNHSSRKPHRTDTISDHAVHCSKIMEYMVVRWILGNTRPESLDIYCVLYRLHGGNHMTRLTGESINNINKKWST